ncbi:hypothetical protein L6452_36131 [Arctium lappa]|uniref:Uncharacterized protein n=1 Tax=Arctium lappa TaxID=4217 RepID=A0ACB8Y921_ARCLA|nr:hypothetical protein L6452_36131 [Arctium lappa]
MKRATVNSKSMNSNDDDDESASKPIALIPCQILQEKRSKSSLKRKVKVKQSQLVSTKLTDSYYSLELVCGKLKNPHVEAYDKLFKCLDFWLRREHARLYLRKVRIHTSQPANSLLLGFLDFIDRHNNGEYIKQSIEEGLIKPITMEVPVEESSDSEDGNEPREQNTKRVPLEISKYYAEEKERYKADEQARSLLLQSIPNEIYIKIDSYKDIAKKMWDQLEKMMTGSKIGNQMKVANCINSYEEFKAKEEESLEATYDRFVSLLNKLAKNKVKKKQIESNVKFLSVLQPEWKKHTRQMK